MLNALYLLILAAMCFKASSAIVNDDEQTLGSKVFGAAFLIIALVLFVWSAYLAWPLLSAPDL